MHTLYFAKPWRRARRDDQVFAFPTCCVGRQPPPAPRVWWEPRIPSAAPVTPEHGAFPFLAVHPSPDGMV